MNRTQIWRRVFLVAAILWALFIWSNSLQTADESSQVSLGVLEWFAPMLTRIGLSEEIQHTLIRKLAHMAEFAVAGLLWSAVLSPKTENALRIQRIRRGVVLLICFAIAALDETIQLFVSGRSGELRDVGIDLLGSAIGICATAVVNRIIVSRMKKFENVEKVRIDHS